MTDGEFAIEIDDLRFAWTAQQPLLQIGRLAVGRKERVFVQGSSGSGKSTLLAIIGGVLSADAGSIKVLDQDMTKLSGAGRDAFRADRIGFIFQMFNLLPYLTVVENVTIPCRFSARRRAAAIEQSGSLEAEARRLLRALGLDDEDLLGRKPTNLSVGQQQRVAAARALIGRPDLIIADEPTSSLDADAREDFIDLLSQEATTAGAAVVFVSHDQSLGSRFDRTVAIGDINA